MPIEQLRFVEDQPEFIGGRDLVIFAGYSGERRIVFEVTFEAFGRLAELGRANEANIADLWAQFLNELIAIANILWAAEPGKERYLITDFEVQAWLPTRGR